MARTHQKPASPPTVSAGWQQRDRIWNCALPPIAKLVIFAFLEYDRRGHGADLYPSIERVAWQTGLVYSSVHKAIKMLKQGGILEKVGEVPSRLRGKVNRYRFHADRLPTRPAWSAVTADTLRKTAPVNPDTLRHTASVDPRPTPSECATDSVIRMTDSVIDADRLRNSARHPPSGGDDRKNVIVRTDRKSVNVRTDRSTSGEDAGEVRSATRTECPDVKCADPEDVALAAYHRLTPAAQAELVNDARSRLKAMLDRIGQPEHRDAMIERSILRELENPSVRERYGVLTPEDKSNA